MWAILVVSDHKELIHQFRACMDPDIDISTAGDVKDALEKLRERRFDFLFIDIKILAASRQENGYKALIKSFKDLYPTLDIIVMSSTDMLRDAVAAVRDGASDYITYPVKGDEVRHVIKSIHESTIVKSELDYLRDQFWEEDSVEITQTLSIQMIGVYNKKPGI